MGRVGSRCNNGPVASTRNHGHRWQEFTQGLAFLAEPGGKASLLPKRGAILSPVTDAQLLFHSKMQCGT
jgi:hypothetical protein